MKVLVAYASKHGATQGIAERVAKTLAAQGHAADVLALPSYVDAAAYDACVVGSAVYLGRWRKEAVMFVKSQRVALSGRPLWLFSSGPLGASPTDPKGRDLRTTSMPKEAGELAGIVRPRDHHVFFGALGPKRLNPLERMLRALPAGKALMPAGDFRDWDEVEVWAKGVASELSQGQSPASAS
jgi:menaquinone-dependent protoporphyrinogen oxidase